MAMTRRTLRSGKGATLVEFAMVFPLLMVLIFAVMDFGMYFFVQHSIQYATREGVRLALVGRTVADPGNPSTQLSREASIAQIIKSKASVAVRPAGVSVFIYPVDATFADPSGWQTATPDAGLAGSYMRVKTRYTYQLVTPLALVGFIVPSKLRVIEVQATYRNELFN
jgi:Flp pilus assembly protein TadG